MPLPRQPATSGGTWVQLPASLGLGPRALQRLAERPAAPALVETIHQPVTLAATTALDGTPRWLLANGRLRAAFGAAGLEQIWGADGAPRLAAALQWCRWRDQGEFWDAWDLARDYRRHPLPLHWDPAPEVAESGPLCARLLWRGRCGASALRLDVQLRAASPWLELTLRVDWCQRHELLRLDIPLAQSAVRLAADTSGGVLERPATPCTAREQARWEVPAISWMASQPCAGAGGGLAVLLDGPQGVSGDAGHLGVSLLRAPTWPDPGADNGLQRLRLALMPCGQGWRQDGVPQEARRFREPHWLRPALRSSEDGAAAPAPHDAPDLPPLGFGSEGLQLVGLEPGESPGEAWLTLQNLSPQRCSVQLTPGWRLAEGPAMLAPWQLRRLRLRRAISAAAIVEQ